MLIMLSKIKNNKQLNQRNKTKNNEIENFSKILLCSLISSYLFFPCFCFLMFLSDTDERYWHNVKIYVETSKINFSEGLIIQILLICFCHFKSSLNSNQFIFSVLHVKTKVYILGEMLTIGRFFYKNNYQDSAEYLFFFAILNLILKCFLISVY